MRWSKISLLDKSLSRSCSAGCCCVELWGPMEELAGLRIPPPCSCLVSWILYQILPAVCILFSLLAFQHVYWYSFKITWKDEKAECMYVFPPSARRLVSSKIQLICCTQAFSTNKLLMLMVGWWLDKMTSVVFSNLSYSKILCWTVSMLQMVERSGKWGAARLPPSRKVLLRSRNGAVSPCANLVSERTWGLCSPAVPEAVWAISGLKWSLVQDVKHSDLHCWCMAEMVLFPCWGKKRRKMWWWRKKGGKKANTSFLPKRGWMCSGVGWMGYLLHGAQCCCSLCSPRPS